MRAGRTSDRPSLHLAIWPSLLLLAIYPAIYLHFAVQLVGYPYDIDQGESYDTWSAWMLANGQLPYTDNAQYPFYSSNYPPLWSALVALPMRWTGPHLSLGRVVSLLAAVGCALLVGAAAYRYAVRAAPSATPLVAGAIAAGLFLASPYVFHTTPLARVNGTTLLFALLALSLVEGSSRRMALLGALALGAALFTKQTALDAAAACMLFLALRCPRRALEAGSVLFSLSGALFVALMLATGGAFWLNVVAGNANPFHLEQLFGYLRNFLEIHLLVFSLALIETARSIRQRMWSPWVLYLPLAVGLSLTVGKWGAGESYFLPAIAASSVLAGSLLAELLRKGGTLAMGTPLLPAALRPWIPLVVGLMLFVQLLLFGHGPLAELPGVSDRGFQAAMLGSSPSFEDRRAGDELATLLRSVEPPVLAEDSGFLLAAGLPVLGNPTHLRNLYEAGQWDPSAMVSMVQTRAFGAIVLNAQLYPAPVLSAIGRSYYVDRSVKIRGAEYLVFLPGTD